MTRMPIHRDLFIASLVVSTVLVSYVRAQLVVENSSISVISPYSLHSSKHDGAMANFGVPDYGGSLVGFVVYPENSSLGCMPFDGDKPFKSKSPLLPTILLLDRGDCYFAWKVWNGQQSGAAAVLVADNKDEPLKTMDYPESSDADGYIEKIGIPSVLIEKSFGETLKTALKKGENVTIKLDWSESIPHPDERVEYELWTTSNDECGSHCDEQMNFIKNFKAHAQILENYTQFTPHCIIWFCSQPFTPGSQCESQCINHGRYCAPDPELDFSVGYEGKDVVFENLRQLCVHRIANESNNPWVWWDYMTDFYIRCSMKQQRYSKECAEDVMKSLDLPIEKIKNCTGDPEADVENQVLNMEQDLQVDNGTRGFVTISPTLVINNVQYRGNLDKTAVLKALCAGFKETTEPPICLSGDLETNECLERNGGCWQDKQSNNITACKDTFRGRVCECPLVNGVQYKGDGYTSCQVVGPGKYTINNRGCIFCIERNSSKFGWFLGFLVLAAVAGVGIAGYIFYKYRLQPAAAAAEARLCELTVASSGLAYCDKKVGNGPEAVKGQLIKAHYVGKLDNGTVFDSSYNRGEPLAFRVGVGEVIKGWDEGILGGDGVPPMLAGGKRTLKLPPQLGYGMSGAEGSGGSCIIPPNSVIFFDVEFIGKA